MGKGIISRKDDFDMFHLQCLIKILLGVITRDTGFPFAAGKHGFSILKVMATIAAFLRFPAL